MPPKSSTQPSGVPAAPDGSFEAGCDVVVGASSGLGAALATYLRTQGRPVVIAARRVDRLQAIAAESAHEIRCAQTDLTAPEQLGELADVIGRYGFVRHLFLVAAADEPQSPTDNIPAHQAEVSDYIRLLFTGWVSLVELLEQRSCLVRSSVVVGISSIAAGVPFAALPLYGGGKAALEQWMRAKRFSSAARYVVVRPGRFDSEFYSPGVQNPGLPIGLARTIVKRVQAGHDEISLGSWRDRFASAIHHGARWLGQMAVRDASPVRGQG